MCTVTIAPFRGSEAFSIGGRAPLTARIACNRDESPSRPNAFPPVVRTFGNCAGILPIDPVSGGTWIAANDAGLVFAVLNVNRGASKASRSDRRPRQSRGLVIPRLLACSTLEDAADRLFAMDAALFPPFRIVATDGHRYWNAKGGAAADGLRIRRLRTPVMFTSSGLGDDLVRAPRTTLFERAVSGGKFSPEEQDAFHAHQWPDRSELSVCMRRNGAETVSYTTIELRRDSVAIRYFGRSPQRAADPSGKVLPIRVRC